MSSSATAGTILRFQEILDFWFVEIDSKKWWVKDPDFDQEIRSRFDKFHAAARTGELVSWRRIAQGRLAEIIVLDQFSRNIFRDSSEAFASDGMALVLAQEAVERGVDNEISMVQIPFLYMPFMHSESGIVHEQAVELFTRLGTRSNLDYELRHKAIIDRFGRYPHRNRILGRVSTAEEEAFLSEPGSSF